MDCQTDCIIATTGLVLRAASRVDGIHVVVQRKERVC